MTLVLSFIMHMYLFGDELRSVFIYESKWQLLQNYGMKFLAVLTVPWWKHFESNIIFESIENEEEIRRKWNFKKFCIW